MKDGVQLHADAVRRGKVLLLAATSALATIGSAVAQTPPSTEATEEIVVTAQRKEQNQQDVPIAIQTVTAASLKNAGVPAERIHTEQFHALAKKGTARV